MDEPKPDKDKKEHKKDKPKNHSSETIMVKIQAPYKTYYDSAAFSISATNDTGPFDILPEHHKFITLLNPGDIIVRNDKGEEKFHVDKGIMRVKEDQVTVFLDV